jgi:Zn finger protein HypA/HybF involved in hydrogenase expression
MVKLKCQRCGHEWEYKGKRKYYTSCPDCKTSVKIKADKKRHA